VTISTPEGNSATNSTTPVSTGVTANPSTTNKYAISVPKDQWQEVTVYTYTHNGTGDGYKRSNPVKIKVEFGDHTYGTQNQKEYDYIMANVKQSLDQLFAPGGEYKSREFDWFYDQHNQNEPLSKFIKLPFNGTYNFSDQLHAKIRRPKSLGYTSGAGTEKRTPLLMGSFKCPDIDRLQQF